MVIASVLALLSLRPPDSFAVQADLQGLYHEISQATLQFESDEDIDQFHDVLFTPDWQFLDADGHGHAWPEMREEAIRALQPSRLTWMTQLIRKLSLTPGGATVLVDATTVRILVDNDGKYGPKGASHTLTETTLFRDTWVNLADSWKQKSREQIGQPKVVVE